MTITTTGDRLEVLHDSPERVGTDVTDLSADRPGEPGPDMAEARGSTRPMFTITDAATSCSVSRKTITRKLPELAVHGAAKDDDGVWRIPVEALLAVGLHPGRSLSAVAPSAARPVAPVPTPSRPADQDTVTISRDRWDDVRIRLARAEAEASERGLALADARLALRALTAGPVAASRASQAMDRPGAGCTARPTRGDRRFGCCRSNPGSGAGCSRGRRLWLSRARGRRPDQGVVSSPGPTSPVATSPEMSVPAPGDGLDAVPADVVAARNLAARTGGYVPSGATPARKRRWWQSR